MAAWLRDRNRLAEIGGTPYLAQLSDATPAVAHVEDHARIVADKACQRRVIALGHRLAAEGYAGVPDVATWAETAANDLTAIAAGQARSTGVPVLDAVGIFAPLEPINYIVEAIDLCPGAPAMWAGYGYTGKTAAAQSAAVAIASGHGKVWDCFGAVGGRVLHLDYEQGSRLTCERYQRLAFPFMVGPSDLAGRLSLVAMPSFYLDEPTAEAELARLVAGYDLVIVDSLRACAPRVDENSSDVRRVLDMMTRVSEKTGAAFVVIHHARKPNQSQMGGAKMAIRGSGALFDACGSVLVFEAEKGRPSRVSHEKARASGILTADFELAISDVPADGNERAGLAVLASTALSREQVAEAENKARRIERTSRLSAEIRTLFEREPEQGGADTIATKLGRKPADVRPVLKTMIEAGKVIVTGKTSTLRHRWVGR